MPKRKDGSKRMNRMMLFNHFTVYHTVHGSIKNALESFAYDNVGKLDTTERKRLNDILKKVDQLGELYDDQICDIADEIGALAPEYPPIRVNCKEPNRNE